MKKLKRLLILLWRIDSLEQRLATLEGELVLRVAKLEADAALIECNRDRARQLFSKEPRAKNTDKRFEWVLETLTQSLESEWIFMSRHKP